ncbi:hypothetical protein [Streptomyces sp. FXY-T5]|nr:hypothetical protein [Streptomyces sp. FXY-T5]WMD05587.1 hypothetical protein Q7C01_14820 [Streptomyces sp. FXY-T5]
MIGLGAIGGDRSARVVEASGFAAGRAEEAVDVEVVVEFFGCVAE